MRCIETRSLKSFEYLELFSPKRRGRTLQREINLRHLVQEIDRCCPTKGEGSVQTKRLEGIQPHHLSGQGLSLFSTSSTVAQNITHSASAIGTVSNQQVLVPPTVMARQFAFVPFNQGSPLNLAQHDNIPLVALKSLPEYLGEGQTTTLEHIRDVATLCYAHHITQDNVAVRLLATSLRACNNPNRL